jgi:hypothetical protein
MPVNYSGEISSLQDLLNILDSANIYEANHAYLRNWFRGQTSHFDLQPGVYRKSFNVTTEYERLEKEQHLSQDFRAQSAGLFKNQITDIERYFIQQHYGMPTRLLDWSLSPLSALYFATFSNDAEDGEVYMMDAFQLYITQKAEHAFKGVPTSRHPIFDKALNVIFLWETIDNFPEFIIPVRPDLTDIRINQQRGCFTFHVPKNPILTTEQNDSLKIYVIPASKKQAIRHQLKVFGVDNFNIFQDLESLAKTIKNNHRIS